MRRWFSRSLQTAVFKSLEKTYVNLLLTYYTVVYIYIYPTALPKVANCNKCNCFRHVLSAMWTWGRVCCDLQRVIDVSPTFLCINFCSFLQKYIVSQNPFHIHLFFDYFWKNNEEITLREKIILDQIIIINYINLIIRSNNNY